MFCDGFEQRDHPIGILTFPDPSYSHFVLMALKFNPNVTIFTNGPLNSSSSSSAAAANNPAVQNALNMALASHAKLDERKIKRLVNNGHGPENGITIEFEEEEEAGEKKKEDATTTSTVKLGMLLHRPKTKNKSQHLIDQLGIKTKEGSGEIVVDQLFGETNVKGCFAAGDTSELLKQVAISMGSGISWKE